MAIASVDGGLLFQVVWSSLLAGVFVTGLFSVVVVFSSRSAEARRSGRGGTGAAYAALAVAVDGPLRLRGRLGRAHHAHQELARERVRRRARSCGRARPPRAAGGRG